MMRDHEILLGLFLEFMPSDFSEEDAVEGASDEQYAPSATLHDLGDSFGRFDRIEAELRACVCVVTMGALAAGRHIA